MERNSQRNTKIVLKIQKKIFLLYYFMYNTSYVQSDHMSVMSELSLIKYW